MVFDDRRRGLEEEYFARQNKEAIEKLREKLRASAAANAGPTSMRCPRCEGNLNETKLDDISIDVCDKCGGVWLDEANWPRSRRRPVAADGLRNCLVSQAVSRRVPTNQTPHGELI